MGYGLGIFLLALGLVLALAVQDTLSGVDLTMVGWILAAVGLGAIILTAVTTMSNRRARTVQTTTNSDGSQTVRESRTEI